MCAGGQFSEAPTSNGPMPQCSATNMRSNCFGLLTWSWIAIRRRVTALGNRSTSSVHQVETHCCHRPFPLRKLRSLRTPAIQPRTNPNHGLPLLGPLNHSALSGRSLTMTALGFNSVFWLNRLYRLFECPMKFSVCRFEGLSMIISLFGSFR